MTMKEVPILFRITGFIALLLICLSILPPIISSETSEEVSDVDSVIMSSEETANENYNADSVIVTPEISEDVYEIDPTVAAWDSLIPEGAYDFVPEEVSFTLALDPSFLEKLDRAGELLNPKIDKTNITIAGFMVPLDMSGSEVRSFLLVPEAGQCIHVPPPPVNQTIYVEVENKPIKLRDLYEPFVVNGLVTVFSKSHDLVTNPTAFSAIQDDPSSPSLEDLQSRGVSLTTSAISGYKILLESVEDFVWE